MSRPSVADLTGDHAIAQLARRHWLTHTPVTRVLPESIESLWDAVDNDPEPSFALLLLEQLQAVERYLWPGYTDATSNHHVLLLALLVNVKRQEQLPVWSLFSPRPDAFASLFRRIEHMSLDSALPTKLRTHLLAFLLGAFQNLDSGLVRKECAPLVSIGIWENLHTERAREHRLAKSAQLQKAWRAAARKFEVADAEGQARLRLERSWLYTLLLDFLDRLYDGVTAGDQRRDTLLYCERFIELLCDLQSQLPTRRYVNTLLQDLNVLPAIQLSPLYQDGDDAALLRDMHRLLEHYTNFPIDDQSGRVLSRQEYDEAHNARIARLQNVALKMHPDKLKILILASYGSLAQKDEVLSHTKDLSDLELVKLCQNLGLRTSYPERSRVVQDRALLDRALASTIEHKPLYTEIVRNTPILPTEQVLFDQLSFHTDEYDGTRPLAIPKLNLQYLALGDFLYRSFSLYRSEAFYGIRKHVEDTIKRLRPRRQGTTTGFDGFSTMAIPIGKPAVIEALPPRVGEDVPAEVKVEVILDVSRLQPGLRKEWEVLRPNDVVFLLAVQSTETERSVSNGHSVQSANEQVGLKTLRCAEVVSVLDDKGRALRFNQEKQNHGDNLARPKQRRLLLRLDAAAYKSDKERIDAGKSDVYDSINVIVRRRARENNFKSVLENLKQLTLAEVALPSWLHDVFLGFGDPSSASYKRLPNRLKTVDYRDTFLDWHHLIESLPGKTVEPDPNMDGSFPPPYVLESMGVEAVPAPRPGKKRRRDQLDGPESVPSAETLRVTTYTPPDEGPYPVDAPRRNTIRFTPSQIQAVTSGTQPGLTLIVGPPGTGKTDVTTQIISNIYHNNPNQRTLLVAHSNQALNQLFQKIVKLDIDERHLLRLGHGEEELVTEGSFGKVGRVNSLFERGAVGLSEVQRLADSLGIPGAHGGSCETAEYFEQVHVSLLWRHYWDKVATGADVVASFPFHIFFANTPSPLFSTSAGRDELIEIARGCERHTRKLFDELAALRPFEIVRSPKDQANYLLVKEARIIAMTTTHAAMRRREIAALGFRYENLVMEEAAQVTEAESFLPMLMQSPQQQGQSGGQLGLQRVVLVGDHLQNSPVVQNAAFRTYANLEQSLFQRLVRIGVPHILLDAQGRSRSSLAALCAWRYPELTNLPATATSPEFGPANAGFRWPYQFVDVPDYKGRGETAPSPHFLQNLGEAEYAVALFQYMRLLGYPAAKISVLCTYAGQRALIREVLERRCGGKWAQLFGMPGWVGTVDKYQGEQNDYVILSLVRTKAPGYLRDVRRLTVALSRARLGLYVLGRREVFESSLELREAFAKLMERSGKLALVPGEMFPTARGEADEAVEVEMDGVEHLGQYVHEMTQAKVKDLRGGKGAMPPPTIVLDDAKMEVDEVDDEGYSDGEGAGYVAEASEVADDGNDVV